MNDKIYQNRKAKTPKAQVIDSELERLHNEEGHVSPTNVLGSASDPDSPLHNYFEWDNEVAGHKYRLQQAREMIERSHFILQIVEGLKKPPINVTVRRYLPLGDKSSRFKIRNEVLSDEEARAAVVDGHITRLESWVSATVDIEELHPLRKHIQAGLKKYTS